MPNYFSNLTPEPSDKKGPGDKKAYRVRQLWFNAKGGLRSTWQEREQRSYDFFLNDQLTAEELDALEAAGMPTFIINRITPVIETMKYFVTANAPRWKAVGVDGSDSKLARMHTDVIDYAWYNSDGQAAFSQAVLDSLTKGKGYILVDVDPDADRGLGEVKFTRVDPFHVYTNSMTYDPFERDAKWQIIKKDMPRSALMDMLPKYADTIKKANGQRDNNYFTYRDLEHSDSIQEPDLDEPLLWDGKVDDVLGYYELYEPEQVLFWNLTVQSPPSDAEMQEASRSVEADLAEFQEELKVQLAEKELELENAVQRGEIIPLRAQLELKRAAKMQEQAVAERRQLLLGAIQEEASKIERKVVTDEEYQILIKSKVAKNIVDAVEFYERRIKKTCVVGDKLLYEELLNIKYLPLVAIPYMHTGTPYPMSAVTPLVGKQREINKAHQIMIHHANLSSSLRWLAVEGEVDNDEWSSYASSSGAVLYYRPGYSQQGPREIYPQPINNAFFTAEQDSKSDLEYMAGIHPVSMGMSSGQSDETYRGFLAKDEYGTRRIKAWVNTIVEPALVHIGRVFQEVARNTYSTHKIFRIIQPNNTGGYDTRILEVNAPMYDDMGEIVGRYNDYSSGRYDIRLVAGSTLPVNRWAVLEEYKQYLEMGVIDDIAFLKETDIEDKDQILERISAIKQMKQQVESLEDVIQEKEGTIETLSRQLVQAGIKMQVMQARMEIDRGTNKVSMSQELADQRIRDELKMSRELLKKEMEKKKSDSEGKKKE